MIHFDVDLMPINLLFLLLKVLVLSELINPLIKERTFDGARLLVLLENDLEMLFFKPPVQLSQPERQVFGEEPLPVDLCRSHFMLLMLEV